MNNQEYYKFLGKLYDSLLESEIINYGDKAKDLKEKKNRVEKYLEKLKRVQDEALGNDRYLDMIKELYYDRYIIKEENIPVSYFEGLEKQYLEEGKGHINLVNPQTSEDIKKRHEHIEELIKAQKDSLDNWLNYFLSEDSSYLPMWVKVWAFQGMLHIGNLNKNKDGYDRRSKTSINPFVSFDSKILDECFSLIKEKLNKEELNDEEVKKLVSSGSFSKIYGKLLANRRQIKAKTTEGIWVKYNKETHRSIDEKMESGKVPEYIKLYNSLQTYNTGWCTADSREKAKTQVLGGDFYVYYSKDEEEIYTIPRLAIRMDENNIGEIRGIARGEYIESVMEEILEEKLREFPDADNYKKKVSDMKKLTEVYNKHQSNEELTKEDLRFLYEFDDKIQGFGYYTDPRIIEIIGCRNKIKDFSIIINCSEEQICLNKKDVKENQIYYGDYKFICNLKNIDKIEIPLSVKQVYLNYLTSAEGLNLSSSVKEVYLNGLISAEGLILPDSVKWVILNSLTNANCLNLPDGVERVSLNGIISAEGLNLPDSIECVFLNGLINAKGLKLPDSVKYLALNGLTSVDGLVIPSGVKQISLNSLINAEGLKLPNSVERVSLDGLINIEGLDLPSRVKLVSLNGLETLKDLILPNEFVEIDWRGKTYSVAEIRKLQEEEKNSSNKYIFNPNIPLNGPFNSVESNKSKGIISNSLLIFNLFLFGILTFIITLLMLK